MNSPLIQHANLRAESNPFANVSISFEPRGMSVIDFSAMPESIAMAVSSLSTCTAAIRIAERHVLHFSCEPSPSAAACISCSEKVSFALNSRSDIAKVFS